MNCSKKRKIQEAEKTFYSSLPHVTVGDPTNIHLNVLQYL